MLFIALVVIPALRNFQPQEKRTEVISATATRFRKIGWIAIIILAITGLINVINRGITHEMIASGSLLSTHFGKVLAIKLILFVIMILLSLSHDFILGPRHLRLLQSSKSNPAKMSDLNKSKKLVSWLARVNVVISVLIVACAVMLS
ncbi:MAG TPA: CopD family protein [Thermodesulfobacteriota bacterium]|nr:CopD family protein [Thermodesulfobacteriota bacterium]